MPHPLNHDIVLRFRVEDGFDPKQVLIEVLAKLKKNIAEVHKDYLVRRYLGGQRLSARGKHHYDIY